MADSGTGAEKFKMSLEHLIGPESKEVLKKQKDGGCQRDIGTTGQFLGSNPKNSQCPKLEEFEQHNK